MPSIPLRRPLLAACAALAFLPAAAMASGQGPAPDYRPDEVVVRYAPSADRAARAAAQRATGAHAPEAVAPHVRTLRLRPGAGVRDTARALRRRPGVLSATPNYVAHASGFVPNDPGTAGVPGGWARTQWNFLAETGVNAPDAWEHLIAAGRPGASGIVVAVLDTGVAYADRDRFRRSYDFASGKTRAGYDFVADDPYPNDENGHGTHVASTIAESSDNGLGLTGLAYGARILPVRVLDSHGEGDGADIARGIRFAARRGAQVINLSFEFDTDVTAAGIPEILDALRFARSRGAIIVGASGNQGDRVVAYPARSSSVLSVGAVTEHGCQAEYSNRGPTLGISAPGGGVDAALPDEPACRPLDKPGRDIFQVTFDGSVRRFGTPSGYVGTSMATPHVSATAALVIASGVLGPAPTPAALTAHLRRTARDLGPPGDDSRYGAGLVDAAAATVRAAR